MNQAAMQDFGKLVLRIALGALILLHGISKLKNGLGPIEGMVVAHGFPGFVAYGVLVGEVLAPLMLLFGVYARIGAVIVAVNMLFAFALAH
ncbi:MAG TPA: DoxX family protein, partial [Luteimonas sp.]|nr:DoxX family protein [Luteimonas sp.]